MTTPPAGRCPRCGTRLLPGALACINCDLPIAPTAPAVSAPTPAAPAAYAAPAPPPYAPPPPYAAPPSYTAPPSYPAPPAYPGQGWGPAPWTTNGLSIASLVLSLLWLVGLGSLLGVIFGVIARRQIRRQPQRGEGMALAGLIIGVVGLIGAVVFFALLPNIINSGAVQGALVQQDMHSAADAEHHYHDQNDTYTGDPFLLRADGGFDPLGHNTIQVAYTESGYCIVGARDGSSTWYLYDSNAGGLLSETFDSAAQAEADCTVTGANNYSTVN